jgi:uncharacterized protein YybS (DUF2232 family)
VIVLIYTILSFKVLFPEMIDKSIEITRQKMEATGKATDSQIEQQMTMMREHFTLFAVVGVVIGSAILGLISSLIGAAVARKKPQDPFGNQPV